MLRGCAVKRVRKGVVRVEVLVDLERRALAGARITGDFFAYPEDAVWRLEEGLRGAPLGEVRMRVLSLLRGVRLVGSTPEDFAEALEEAVERAVGACKS